MNTCEKDEEIMKKYKLSKMKHEEIYNHVHFLVLGRVKPVKKPTAIIVGGQSGSGKSFLVGYSKKIFKSKNICIVSADEFMPLHPKMREIALTYPMMLPQIIEQDRGDWVNRLLSEVIDKKYNFIFEITLKNDRIVKRIIELKEKGFKVIIRIMAVPFLESLISIHERYLEQVKIRGWGRIISIENHNLAYKNMPQIVDYIEKNNLADIIEVYKRGTINEIVKVYDSTSDNNEYSTAEETIKYYQNINVHIEEYGQRIERLQREYKIYCPSDQELNQLNELIFQTKKIMNSEENIAKKV